LERRSINKLLEKAFGSLFFTGIEVMGVDPLDLASKFRAKLRSRWHDQILSR